MSTNSEEDITGPESGSCSAADASSDKPALIVFDLGKCKHKIGKVTKLWCEFLYLPHSALSVERRGNVQNI